MILEEGKHTIVERTREIPSKTFHEKSRGSRSGRGGCADVNRVDMVLCFTDL
jgi:hypothetical protein